MSHPVDESSKEGRPTTTLDRVRPTVVVRRRVYDVPTPAAADTSAKMIHVPAEDGDDDAGPPSSVNVARALASLRADELVRLEQILGRPDEGGNDDDDAAEVPVVVEPPSAPVVRVGATIPLGELARRMAITSDTLVTALVTGGFFAINGRTKLPHETARVAAGMFGWRVEVEDDVVAPAKPAPKAAKAAKSKAKPRKPAR